MRILSLSTVFPTPADPTRGVFICSRLRHLADLAEVKVIAPVLYGASSGSDRWNSSRRVDGRLEILHPRWIYPPGTGLFTDRKSVV